MIQNQTILKKINEKTLGDPPMYKFVMNIMNNESAGKQYKNFYKNELSIAIKARKEGEKNNEI